MAQVRQLDKRSGITYVYESVARWDKEKRQSRAVRKLVGRLDPKTGEVLPTDGRGRRRRDMFPEEAARRLALPAIRRRFAGATCLFDGICRSSGVLDDLKRCFPGDWKAILSVAYYLIIEDSNPLSRFGRWSATHRHPLGADLPSQRSSELFAGITEAQRMEFFRLQARRRAEDEYWALDTTSISSYSEALEQVRWGRNKDYDPLPQINLALLFGEKSGLPFYYRKLPGNVPDVKTVLNLLRETRVLGVGKMSTVFDRGFCSYENVDSLFTERRKFITGANTSLAIVRRMIDETRAGMRDFGNYCDEHGVHALSQTAVWDYERKRPYKGDVLKEDRRIYVHLFFNPERAVEDETAFNRRMAELRRELASGTRVAGHEKAYERFFSVTATPKRGVKVSCNDAAMAEARSRFGYFALLSNEVKDPVAALEIYRCKDVVEKAFSDIKGRLNCRRTLVSSERSLDGKLFVEFVALIILSYIKKRMQDAKLFHKYTLQGLIDELDVIECLEVPGKDPIYGEVLQRQADIYAAMGVETPRTASLCVTGI